MHYVSETTSLGVDKFHIASTARLVLEKSVWSWSWSHIFFENLNDPNLLRFAFDLACNFYLELFQCRLELVRVKTRREIFFLAWSCIDSFNRKSSTATKPEDQMKRGLRLDIVIWKSTTILQLLASKNKALLVRRDSFFVLDFLFDDCYGIWRLDVDLKRLSCQCFNNN